MNEQDSLRILAEVQGTYGAGVTYYMSDSFLYLSDRVTEGARYFRCKKYRKGCPVRVILYSNGSTFCDGIHDHPDAIPELLYRKTRLNLLQLASNISLTSFQHIINDPRNEFGANPLYSYHRLLPSVIRAQTSGLRCDNLAQLNAVLTNPAYTHLTQIESRQDSLHQGTAQCSDGSIVILLMSKSCCDFLRILPSVCFLHIPVVLSNRLQLEICLVGGIYVNNVLPLAWILSESYSEESVTAGLTLLKSTLNHYAFSLAMCKLDFAASIFARIFSVDVCPSLYDFINDIATLIRGTVNRNHSLNKVAQLCCALPLLPLDCLQLGIDYVKRQASQLDTTSYYEALRMFNLIEEEWLKCPERKFLVDRTELIDRTDYGCENLKNQITAKFSQSNPDFFMVIRYIISQSRKSEHNIKSLLQGGRLQRRVPVPLNQQPDVIVLLQGINRPSFSIYLAIESFLLAVSEKVEHLVL